MKDTLPKELLALKKELEAVKAELPDMMMLYETIVGNGFNVDDIIRAVVLVANVKKMSQWGKVTILLKEGNIVAVEQQQQFITTKELERVGR